MKPASCAPATLRARAALFERSTSEGQDDDRVAIRLRTRFPISDAGQPNASQSGAHAVAHAKRGVTDLSAREETGAPWVPTRAPTAGAPGDGGWIPVPDSRNAWSTRVFVERSFARRASGGSEIWKRRRTVCRYA